MSKIVREQPGFRLAKLDLESELRRKDKALAEAAALLVLAKKLGIVPSFSRPNVSDDNPFVEALFRTLKYRPGYASQCFVTLEQATPWVARFVQ